MSQPSLAEFLQAVRTELGNGLSGAVAKSVVTVRFVSDLDTEGALRLRPVLPADLENRGGVGEHTLVIELPGASVAGSPALSVALAPRVNAPLESGIAVSGDRQTLRRRLELLLGGPPGFTTGAKAEVLADLLEEFGRGDLLETIRRDWITQFDTGPEMSVSVTKLPPGRDDDGRSG
jgi:hypothetical protein